MKDRFNEYCADVMQISYMPKCKLSVTKLNTGEAHLVTYNPYDDLNQMADAFDKLNLSGFDTQGQKFHMDIFVKGLPIKPAMRDFITSTMPEQLIEAEKDE